MRIDAMWYFLNIAEMRSMSKVAKKFSVPQQSLSSMIASIENDLGVQLLIRERNNLKLTEEGQLFYNYCEQFFRSYRQLKEQLFPDNMKFSRTQLLISTQNNIAQTLIPKWMGAILRTTPAMRVDVKIRDAFETIDDVFLEKSDVGFILRFEKGDHIWPDIPEQLIYRPLFFSKPCFWVNKDCSLARNKTLQMKMLSPYLVIQDHASDLSLFRYIFEEHFKLELNYIQAVNARIMVQLVKENIAICPDLRVQDGEPTLASSFNDCENVKVLPISQKDEYKLSTGYIFRQNMAEDKELEQLFALL